MSKRVLLLILCTLLTIELYQISSYFPIKAKGRTRENLLTEVIGKRYDEEPSVKGVYIRYDKEVEYQFVKADTAEQALENLGYHIGSNNRVTTNYPENALLNNSIITIQTYHVVVQEKTISIPFETIAEGTSLCPNLSRIVIQKPGAFGLMTEKIEKLYLDNELVEERVLEQTVIKEPIKEILTYSGASHKPTSITNLGHNCDYWRRAIDSLDASEEEKRWLDFTMRGETGCNAESSEGTYKGLFQWNPCLWYKLFPNDNIFDGNAQIRRTLQKVREGANPRNMWPGVYKAYVAKYGKLSWLSD